MNREDSRLREAKDALFKARVAAYMGIAAQNLSLDINENPKSYGEQRPCAEMAARMIAYMAEQFVGEAHGQAYIATTALQMEQNLRETWGL